MLTGMRAADELLDGGLLAGATHCISGKPTSGATSLFYQAVAGAPSKNCAFQRDNTVFLI